MGEPEKISLSFVLMAVSFGGFMGALTAMIFCIPLLLLFAGVLDSLSFGDCFGFWLLIIGLGAVFGSIGVAMD
jgi:hypothetical protein